MIMESKTAYLHSAVTKHGIQSNLAHLDSSTLSSSVDASNSVPIHNETQTEKIEKDPDLEKYRAPQSISQLIILSELYLFENQESGLFGILWFCFPWCGDGVSNRWCFLTHCRKGLQWDVNDIHSESLLRIDTSSEHVNALC